MTTEQLRRVGYRDRAGGEPWSRAQTQRSSSLYGAFGDASSLRPLFELLDSDE
jgi:hypothetical protein